MNVPTQNTIVRRAYILNVLKIILPFTYGTYSQDPEVTASTLIIRKININLNFETHLPRSPHPSIPVLPFSSGLLSRCRLLNNNAGRCALETIFLFLFSCIITENVEYPPTTRPSGDMRYERIKRKMTFLTRRGGEQSHVPRLPNSQQLDYTNFRIEN